MRSLLTQSFIAQGQSPARAAHEAAQQAQAGRGDGSIPHFVRLDFAHATRDVLLVMAGVMVVAAAVALVGLKAGVQQPSEAADAAEVAPT
jgi:hypothetical protein